MSPSIRHALVLALLLAPLAGCPAAAPTGTGASAPPYRSPLTNLVAPEDVQAQATLDKPITLTFPITVGIAYYDFETGLKPEDEQQVIAEFKEALAGTGVVTDTILIPTGLLKSGTTIESIRLLGARFKCDVLLLVSGNTTYQLADEQPTNLFDAFGGRAFWEARTTLVAITMDIRTATYLAPYQAVGVKGPTLLASNSAAYYKLRQDAEFAAWTKLRADVVKSVDTLQKRFGPLPVASPSPTASPTPAAATAAPSPASVAATAAPSAEPTATPSPTPEPSRAPTILSVSPQ